MEGIVNTLVMLNALQESGDPPLLVRVKAWVGVCPTRTEPKLKLVGARTPFAPRAKLQA